MKTKHECKHCSEDHLQSAKELAAELDACTKAYRRADAAREQLEDTLAKLTAWIADLQSGGYVNCVYCGYRYGPAPETPTSMADELKDHIEQCPEHPMSDLKRKLAIAVKALRAFTGTIESRQNAFWADTAEKALTEIEK